MFSLKILFLTLVCIISGLLFFHNDAFAQTPTCTTPGVPPNVLITYPACQGVNCNPTQATCTWGAANGAANYSIKVTEIDSNTVINTQTLPAATLNFTFGVTSGKTYKCDVTAVNSCGANGTTGTFSLLCQTDVVSTPTPTLVPGATVPPIQQLPATGNNFILMALGVTGGIIMFFGAVLLKL
ncbi:MAG: hypothetical protein ACHQT7_00130 [Candidatus Levyibacteriota bacterium]